MSELKDKLLKAIFDIDFDNLCKIQKDTLQKALVMIQTKWNKNNDALNIKMDNIVTLFPSWNWGFYDYFIIPEKKIVPFDFSDAEKLIGKTIKHKDNGSIHLITNLNNHYVFCGSTSDTYEYVYYNFTYLDGSVIGKEVEVWVKKWSQ